MTGGTLSDTDLKHRSRALTEGPERAAARAYLKGIGFDDDALAKPLIGVAHCWIETMPCNFNHRALAAKVKEGVAGRGRHADGAQHHRHLRRHHDGDERHEDLAGLPRGHR